MLDNYYEDEMITDVKEYSFEKGAQFISCKFDNIDLSDRNLNGIKFIECEFVKCNLSNVLVLGTSFREVSFKDCKILGVNFSSCERLFQFSSENSILNYCVFQSVEAPSISFNGCELKEVDFSDANMQGGSFENSNLSGALFNNTNLMACSIVGATNYQIDPSFTKIKKASFSMPEAMSLLESLDIKVEY